MAGSNSSLRGASAPKQLKCVPSETQGSRTIGFLEGVVVTTMSVLPIVSASHAKISILQLGALFFASEAKDSAAWGDRSQTLISSRFCSEIKKIA